VETRIDTTATLRSLLIWRATALTHSSPRERRANTYCAAHDLARAPVA
jgi:hypothetical protein